jgi:hypothetical protein
VHILGASKIELFQSIENCRHLLDNVIEGQIPIERKSGQGGNGLLVVKFDLQTLDKWNVSEELGKSNLPRWTQT